jgi:short-subunit dehydrogenase
MRKFLIFGATSAIARNTARLYARDGDRLFLAGRNAEKIQAVARDLLVRGAGKADYFTADLDDIDLHETVIRKAVESLGGLDTVLIAFGTLSDQKACEQDYRLAEREIRTNFLSVVSLLTSIANLFERQGGGSIAVISSVAGDRARRSNYVYGTAKGAVSLFLQGLRNRLHHKGVHVLTVKPGFVDTPMTAHLRKNALFARPEDVARGIYRAMAKKKDVVYLPGYWRFIMAVVRHIPESGFKRLGL